MLPEDTVVDMAFFRDHFFILNEQEDLIAFTEDSRDNDFEIGNEYEVIGRPLTMTRIRYNFQASADRSRHMVIGRFLVESEGKIYMVRHLGAPDAFEFFVLVEKGFISPDTMLARWSKCTNELGGRALFLGMGCSRSEETGMPGKVIVHCSYRDGGWFYA
ncbi:hypothetical protein PR202_gb28264 [Eleusine coracana subsp. coracana]|uniref:KIB1-4 beta-propeller domain-containing protein n=1 Tax=Eleusine coracana subsp. coracana TaxID=191504 RepID=A0AAV5FTW8_ELECO|nr:hypothetical protein PR202_gb28264 [Eleusine coracana subsp. coracana]